MPVTDSSPVSQQTSESRPDRTLVSGVLLSLSLHAAVLAALCLTVFQDGAVPVAPRDDAAVTVRLVNDPDLGAPASAGGRPNPPELADRRTDQATADRPGAALAAAPAPPAPSAATGVGPQAVPLSSVGTERVAADPAAGDSYRQRLLDHISAFRHAPVLSPGERSDGTVMVRFSLTRGGDVVAVSLAASSGVGDLDDEAIATIWRARPMPAIPAVLPDQLSSTLPVTFTSGRRAAAG